MGSRETNTFAAKDRIVGFELKTNERVGTRIVRAAGKKTLAAKSPYYAVPTNGAAMKRCREVESLSRSATIRLLLSIGAIERRVRRAGFFFQGAGISRRPRSPVAVIVFFGKTLIAGLFLWTGRSLPTGVRIRLLSTRRVSFSLLRFAGT